MTESSRDSSSPFVANANLTLRPSYAAHRMDNYASPHHIFQACSQLFQCGLDILDDLNRRVALADDASVLGGRRGARNDDELANFHGLE